MKQMLQICCKNNNNSKEFPIGSSLLDIYYGFNLNFPYQVVSAKVNNRSEGLNFRVYNNKDVEFLDSSSLTFSLLQKVINHYFLQKHLCKMMEYLPNNLYDRSFCSVKSLKYCIFNRFFTETHLLPLFPLFI